MAKFSMRYIDILYIAVRICLGVIFIAASWHKILDPEAFSRIVENYQILPAALVNPTAYILPWIEAVCGVMLVTGFMTKGGTLILNLLMIVFILALFISLVRGLDIACGCFSTATQAGKSIMVDIIRDMGILIAGLWVLIQKIQVDRRKLAAY